VGGLQRPIDRAQQVRVDGAQVHRVLQPGRERGHRLVRVVPGPVEPPVDGVLDTMPHRVEQGGGHERRGRHRHRVVEPEHLGSQQDQPGVHADEQSGDDRVAHGAADDPVDVVQPELEDPEADADRQRERPDRSRDDDRLQPAGRAIDPDQGDTAGDEDHRPAQEPLQLKAALSR
jgi:hypothetical protein